MTCIEDLASVISRTIAGISAQPAACAARRPPVRRNTRSRRLPTAAEHGDETPFVRTLSINSVISPNDLRGWTYDSETFATGRNSMRCGTSAGYG